MRIGEIAKQVEVSTSIIRHYESLGLLPLPKRDSLGYRSYNQADLERIKLVTVGREIGISLPDIKQILAIKDKSSIPTTRIFELLNEKAADVDQHANRLASVKLELCRLRDLALALEKPGAIQLKSQFEKVLG